MAGTMTPRARILAAIRHQPLDRVPCSPRLGQALRILYDDANTPADDLTLRAVRSGDLPLDPQFPVTTDVPCLIRATDADARGVKDIEIEVSVRDDGPCDLITRVIHTPAGPLREVRRKPKPGRREYGLAPNPAHVERLVKTRDDLARLRYLVPDPADYPVGQVYHQTADTVGQDGLVLAVVCSPWDYQAGYAYAMEDAMMAYFQDRAFFDELAGIWFDKMMAETRAVLDAGCRAVFGSWFFTSLSVGWSPAIFRECFLPMIRAHVGLVHAYDAVYDYYDDGTCMGIADMMAEAGVDVFETLTPPPVGDVDLAELKRRVGDRVCLKGYVDLLYVLKMGTPDDVDATVRQAMEAAAPGSGFIIGTSDSVREGTPRANVAAYFDAVRRYGSTFCNR